MILQPRADHCTQRVYPDRFGRPFLNNQEYREYFPKFSSLFNHFHIEILETVEDPKNHKVAFHARSTGETVIGPYANEYMVCKLMNRRLDPPFEHHANLGRKKRSYSLAGIVFCPSLILLRMPLTLLPFCMQIMMQMTNDDKQVEGIKEFVDSAYSDDYFQRLGVHTASK